MFAIGKNDAVVSINLGNIPPHVPLKFLAHFDAVSRVWHLRFQSAFTHILRLPPLTIPP